LKHLNKKYDFKKAGRDWDKFIKSKWMVNQIKDDCAESKEDHNKRKKKF
jgi:hypothetical protein